MKKNLIAVIASGSITGVACAQSSVTVFGVADVMVQHGSGSKSSRTTLASGGVNSSRVGFRGIEDLGDGLSASFWLESTITLDDGGAAPTNTNNQSSGGSSTGQGMTFNRRSTVSLASTRWGELRIGRDYTPHYWNLLLSDPFGNLGSGGSLPYVLGANVIGVTAARVSNSVSYLSPSIAGIALQYTHYRGENSSTSANSRDGTGNSIRIGYSDKSFAAAFSYSKTDYVTGNSRPLNVYAEYDFKVMKVMGLASRDKLGALTGKGYVLGGVIPVGAGDVRLSYSSYETSAPGSPQAQKLAVGYLHNLSKRTAIYTTWGHVKNSGGSAVSQGGATTEPNTSSNGYDLGIRHFF